MSGFLYGLALQWKLDLRSKSLLITCYVVPLLFFFIVGGIFTSMNPAAGETLIPSMTALGVSMGALVGVPPTLAELYNGGCKKIYQANGVPLGLGLATVVLSAFLHLFLMSAILYVAAPLAFGAAFPENPPLFFASLALYIGVSLGVGSILGLSVKNPSKLTMISQMVFLPSMMLSGIMFPANLLPRVLEAAGMIFPATWGYRLMAGPTFSFAAFWPLAVLLLAAFAGCALLLERLKRE